MSAVFRSFRAIELTEKLLITSLSSWAKLSKAFDTFPIDDTTS